MSDTSQGPGWWLASDGRWYPPELAPASPDGSVPAPQWWAAGPPSAVPVSSGLATALRIAFWAMAAVSVVRLLLAVAGWVSFNRFESSPRSGSYDTWRAAETVSGLWGLLVVVGSILLLVLVIIWSWQAHRAVTALGAEQSWRIGWTIGGWFVCCAAIVIPKLVLDGIERASLSPRSDGRVRARWDVRPTLAVGWVWWVALIGSLVQFDYSYSSTGDARADALTSSGLITTSYWVGSFNAVCAVVAALAGAAYFGRMSERLTPEGLGAHTDD